MLSRASFFNPTLLCKNLRRFMPLWAIYTFVILLMLPVNISNNIAYHMYNGGMSDFEHFVLDNAAIGGVCLNFFYSLGVAMAVWSYLYNQRSAGMLHALPLSRRCLYITETATGLIFGLVPQLTGVCAAAIICAANGLAAAVLLRWLAIMAMSYFFFFAFASLLAMLTGNIVILPVAYFIFSFTPLVVEALCRFFGAELCRGLTSSDVRFGFLSPLWQLLYEYSSVDYGSAVYDGMVYLGILTGVGLLCLVGAWLLYRRRAIETAGDVVSVRTLKPVFKYCFTLGCALVVGYVIFGFAFGGDGRAWQILLCLLIGAFLGYFGAQMMLTKTVRVFKRGWVGYIASAAVIIVCVGLVKADVFGLETWIPNPDEVKSVSISEVSSAAADDSESFKLSIIELHRAIVNELDENELLLEQGADIDYDERSFTIVYVYITYTMSNGNSIQRSYRLYVPNAAAERSEAVKRYLSLTSTPFYILRNGLTEKSYVSYARVIKYTMGDDAAYDYTSELEFDGAEADKLFGMVWSEIDAGLINTYQYSYSNAETYDIGYDEYYEVYFSYSDHSSSLWFCVTPKAEVSYAWITENSENAQILY